MKQNSLTIALLLFVLVAAFIHYILYGVPHCCEDINYLAYHSLEQRKNQFWTRTVNEGRWFFALSTAIISGHVITYLFSLITVVSSAITAILVVHLLGAHQRRWWICGVLFAMNPFYLVLYPWPISFAFFHLANLMAVVCFYLYLRKKTFILVTPWIIAICLATYQATLAFLLEVIFLHFLSQAFQDERKLSREKLRSYGYFLLALIFGYLIYLLISKILLVSHGVHGEFRRYDLWSHSRPSAFAEYFHNTVSGFKWFSHRGIVEGINPASSALLRDLSLRSPFITLYKFTLVYFNAALLIIAISKKSLTQFIVTLSAAPISILVTLLPLIASGSGIINRVFYPFGLLLPALILILINQFSRLGYRWFMAYPIAALIILHIALTAQFSTGIADQASFAKATHRDMLLRLYSHSEYSPQKEVVVFAKEPPENKPVGISTQEITGNYWPLYNDTPSFKQFINFYQGYYINIVNRAELSNKEIEEIESYIVENEIVAWPHKSSVFQTPSIRRGIFVVYLELPSLRP